MRAFCNIHCDFHMEKTAFGTITRFLLIKVFAQKGNNIDLIFDKVVSIKDCKHNSRSGYQERGNQYQITGLNQGKPSNWLNTLPIDQFKAVVNSFLVSAWQDDSLAKISQGE